MYLLPRLRSPLWSFSLPACCLGIGLGLIGVGLGAQVQAASVCAADRQIWAEALTRQLPLFANLQLARLRASFRVILVGLPEIESLSPEQLLRLQVMDPAAEEVFVLYFSTLERRLVRGADPNIPYGEDWQGRSTDSLRLYYRAFVVRSADPAAPWQLFSLQVIGSGIASRDISNGAIAQGIRAWQQQGCPQPADFDLSSSLPPTSTGKKSGSLVAPSL